MDVGGWWYSIIVWHLSDEMLLQKLFDCYHFTDTTTKPTVNPINLMSSTKLCYQHKIPTMPLPLPPTATMPPPPLLLVSSISDGRYSDARQQKNASFILSVFCPNFSLKVLPFLFCKVYYAYSLSTYLLRKKRNLLRK